MIVSMRSSIDGVAVHFQPTHSNLKRWAVLRGATTVDPVALSKLQTLTRRFIAPYGLTLTPNRGGLYKTARPLRDNHLMLEIGPKVICSLVDFFLFFVFLFFVAFEQNLNAGAASSSGRDPRFIGKYYAVSKKLVRTTQRSNLF